MMSTISDASDEELDSEDSNCNTNEFPFVGKVSLSRIEVKAGGGGWFWNKSKQTIASEPQSVWLSVCPAVLGQTLARWLIETDTYILFGGKNSGSLASSTTSDQTTTKDSTTSSTTTTTATTTRPTTTAAKPEPTQVNASCISLNDVEVCTSNGTQVTLSFAHCRETYRVECSTIRQAQKLRQATVGVCPHEIYTNVRSSNVSASLCAGDVVLIRTNGIASQIQRFFTRCEWDHVAIVLPEEWGIMLYIGGVVDTLALYEATNHNGVFSCPLRARVEQYLENNTDGQVLVRHLVSDDICNGFENLCWEQLRIQYESSLGQEYSFRGLIGVDATVDTTHVESHEVERFSQEEGEEEEEEDEEEGEEEQHQHQPQQPRQLQQPQQNQQEHRSKQQHKKRNEQKQQQQQQRVELQPLRKRSLSKMNADPTTILNEDDERRGRKANNKLDVTVSIKSKVKTSETVSLSSSLETDSPQLPEVPSVGSSSSGYFCSELVASCFITLGLLDNKLRKRPGYYWPSSFQPGKSIDQHMSDGFHLTEPVFVDLDTD